MDILTDLNWLAESTVLGNINFPSVALERAEKAFLVLMDFIKNIDASRICFTGHSLGGAVAGTMFYLYHLKVQKTLPSQLFTIGSPQLLKSIPDHLIYKDKKVDMNLLSKSVHNIVQRLDIIPRLVAPNTLPEFLTTMKVFGPKIVEIENYFKSKNAPRDGFKCFGNYYALNPGYLERDNVEIKVVDGPTLLNVFSSDMTGLAVAVPGDHSSDSSAEALIQLAPQYKSKFNWGEVRKINGPCLQFPEEFRKKKKEAVTKVNKPSEVTVVSLCCIVTWFLGFIGITGFDEAEADDN